MGGICELLPLFQCFQALFREVKVAKSVVIVNRGTSLLINYHAHLKNKAEEANSHDERITHGPSRDLISCLVRTVTFWAISAS